MDRWIDYDYAIVRIVPQVHRCTFVNAGVILHARTARYVGMRSTLDRERLLLLCPSADADLAGRYLDAYQRIASGAADAGPIALLPASERFHWLTAPRSAVIQTSEVHCGRTREPEQTLEQLFAEYVMRVT
jgi:hypothetical protein